MTWDDTEAEGVSVSEVDSLVAQAHAWSQISAALDENARGEISAADVCEVGFEEQERLERLP